MTITTALYARMPAQIGQLALTLEKNGENVSASYLSPKANRAVALFTSIYNWTRL